MQTIREIDTTCAAAAVTPRPLGEWCVAVLLLIVAAGVGCSEKPIDPCVTCPVGGTAVLVGAGDVAACDPTPSAGTVATANLLDGLSGTVFMAGDGAYAVGSASEYRDCYNPYWGRHKARTWPVPGNHEYYTAGGAGYFGYFGDAAGPPGLGYYRRTLGSWTFLGLNSEADARGSSVQVQWLRSELAAHPTPCTVAIWHRPLFTSGPNRDNPDMRDLWQALYDLKVDVVINGHDHMYERFDLQDPNGNPDPNGIRQFTVGTGGASLYVPITVKRNSQVRISSWGVAQFTLLEGSYTWEFKPIDGGGGTDSGSGGCH